MARRARKLIEIPLGRPENSERERSARTRKFVVVSGTIVVAVIISPISKSKADKRNREEISLSRRRGRDDSSNLEHV